MTKSSIKAKQSSSAIVSAEGNAPSISISSQKNNPRKTIMPAAKLSLSQTPQLILAFVSLLLSSAQVLAETDRDAASPVTSLTLLDIEGNSHQPFQNEKTKACVLLFVSTDCPIANAFQPELRSFHQTYAGKGIDCYMIYCAPRMTVAKVT